MKNFIHTYYMYSNECIQCDAVIRALFVFQLNRERIQSRERALKLRWIRDERCSLTMFHIESTIARLSLKRISRFRRLAKKSTIRYFARYTTQCINVNYRKTIFRNLSRISLWKQWNSIESFERLIISLDRKIVFNRCIVGTNHMINQ